MNDEARASRPPSAAHKFNRESGRAQFAIMRIAWRRGDAPACPCRTGFGMRADKQAACSVSLSEEKQTAGGFEIKRLAARAQCANHNSARRRQTLLGGPKRVLALIGANNQKL